MTGGFGGQTCQMCHNDGVLNMPGGSLTLRGIPQRYQPGARYEMAVVLSRSGLSVGGFQLTARFADGKPAGTWSVTSERAQVAKGGFVQHTKSGVKAEAPGSAEWSMTWVAPESGEVIFNAAANASNDDVSALGDLIYTTEVHTQAQ